MTVLGDSSSGTVTGTMGAYYETHSTNRNGEIFFYARGATQITYSDWLLNLVGWNSVDYSSAIWHVILNPDSYYLTNAIFTDILGPNQLFNDGYLLQAEFGYYDKNTQLFQAVGIIDPNQISLTENSFTVDLGTLEYAVSLTFTSTKTADLTIPYSNQAVFEADGGGQKIIIEAETPGIGGSGVGTGELDEPIDSTDSTSSSSSMPSSESSSESLDKITETTSSESSTAIEAAVAKTHSSEISDSRSYPNTDGTTSSLDNLSTKQAKSLPNTGNATSFLSLFGYVFASLGLFLLTYKRKKRNRSE